jgi:hypothetical protein
MDKVKTDRIHDLMEQIENDKNKRGEFIKWFHPRLSWYVDAKMDYSENQLNEIITFLEGLIYNK